jgi:hypothetical protein
VGRNLVETDWLRLVFAGLCFAIGLLALSEGRVVMEGPHVAKTIHGNFEGQSAYTFGYLCLLASYLLARGPLRIAGRGPLEVVAVIALLGVGYAASAF